MSECYNCGYTNQVEELEDKISALEKQNELLLKTVKYYAVKENYGYSQDHDDHVEWISDEECQSMGKRAREVLGKVGG